MKKVIPIALILFFSVEVLWAQPDGYEQAPNKLYYKIWTEGVGELQPKVGDFATVRIRYRTDQDSILAPWRKLKLEVLEPDYKSHLMEGYTLMKAGDSATFAIPSNVFFPRELGQNRPNEIASKSFVLVDMVMLEVKTKLQMMMGEQDALDRANEKDQQAIQEYLAEKGLSVKPDANGINRHTLREGEGPAIVEGCTIKVHYRGTLLDGRLFDSSYQVGTPFRFVVGKGEVIPGWDKGLLGARKGGKYLLALPSGMAYGKRGSPGSIIGAYTPLIFEVEVINVRFP